MSVVSPGLKDTGLEVIDLLSDSQFAARKLHDRNFWFFPSAGAHSNPLYSRYILAMGRQNGQS
jgi:hypothetical protein